MFEALLKPYLIKQYPCTTEMVHQPLINIEEY